MPAPLPPGKRAAIVKDIKKAKKDGGLSRNEIARTHDVSPSTVTKIAGQESLSDAFDRAQTQQCTRASKFDAAAARAQLVVDLLGDAQRFRARAWEPYTQVVLGPAGPDLVETKLPPLRDQQSACTSVAICLDKGAAVDRLRWRRRRGACPVAARQAG
jgi:hypothetical protein